MIKILYDRKFARTKTIICNVFYHLCFVYLQKELKKLEVYTYDTKSIFVFGGILCSGAYYSLKIILNVISNTISKYRLKNFSFKIFGYAKKFATCKLRSLENFYFDGAKRKT